MMKTMPTYYFQQGNHVVEGDMPFLLHEWYLALRKEYGCGSYIPKKKAEEMMPTPNRTQSQITLDQLLASSAVGRRTIHAFVLRNQLPQALQFGFGGDSDFYAAKHNSASGRRHNK